MAVSTSRTQVYSSIRQPVRAGGAAIASPAPAQRPAAVVAPSAAPGVLAQLQSLLQAIVNFFRNLFGGKPVAAPTPAPGPTPQPGPSPSPTPAPTGGTGVQNASASQRKVFIHYMAVVRGRSQPRSLEVGIA